MSYITAVDGIKLWLLTWLVNYVAMLLVVCQLSRDDIGYEDSNVIGAFWSIYCHAAGDNARGPTTGTGNEKRRSLIKSGQ